MVKKKAKNMLQLEKLLDLQVLRIRQLGRWLTSHFSYAIKHLPDKEELIFRVFKNSVVILFLIKKSPLFKKKILSMLEYQPASKWTTFLDNLNTSKNQNTLTMELLQISLQELTLKEKVCQPFWNPAYKELSEKLLLPTETDFVDLASTSSNNWCQKREVGLRYLETLKTELLNKNLQTTFSPSFTSSLVGKWEKEVIPVVKLKTLRIKIYPTKNQKKILDRFIDTSRYVYNRTLEYINNGYKINPQNLRDLLVTENTKKNLEEYKAFDEPINELKKLKSSSSEEEKKKLELQIKELQKKRRNEMKKFDFSKNPLISQFEIETPKDIRDCAVERCCNAFTTGYANLRNGNIKFFKMKFKKKTEKKQTIELTPKLISVKNGKIKMTKKFFKDDCFFEVDKHNIRRIKDLKIKNNVDITRSDNEYYLNICVETTPKKSNLDTVAGVDLGIRTFATVHSSNATTQVVTEYDQGSNLLFKLNKKLKILKNLRRIRKKQLSKIDKKKCDVVDRIHWDFINDLLLHNDVVYIGDIKSHDIVKNGKNRYINRGFNDLKFYKLKQRLLYKASVAGKKVIYVPEHNTTKTCSSCGIINNEVGASKIFECFSCGLVTGRDINASKNIKMKGILG